MIGKIRCKKFYCIFVVLILLSSVGFSQQSIFTSTTQMPEGRQMHGLVVLGNYIYAIGGTRNSDNFTKSVDKAVIYADGKLGKWEPTTPLPITVSYIDNCTMALNDIVYIATGWDETTKKALNYVYWSRPKIDGHLETWRQSMPYPGEGVHCSSAVATPGYIHVIAGFLSNDTPTNKVWSAKVGSDGTIVGWEPGPTLPVNLWYHNAGVAGGKVWVWGGLLTPKNTSVNKTIYFAPILPNGKLGNWQISPISLPVGFYSASCTISGEYLISFSPRYSSGTLSNDIWYAVVTPSGLTQWIKQSTSIDSRIYMALGTDYRQGIVYISGGRKLKEVKTVLNPYVYFVRLTSRQQKDINTDMAVTVSNIQGTASSKLSYITQAEQTTGAFKGFIPFEIARQVFLKQPKPFVLYFYSKQALKCAEQSNILQTFDSSIYGNNIIFTEVETSQFPQASQQYGIFRVPCWLFYDANGQQRFRKMGVMQPLEIDNLVKQLYK